MTRIERRHRWGRSLAIVLVAIGLGFGVSARAEAAAPWRAETGEPLDGVAVIGVWHRRLVGHGLVPRWPTGIVVSTTLAYAGRA